MHRLASVFTMAFVFASAGLLLEPAAAQVDGSVTGRLCMLEDGYGYAKPMSPGMPESAPYCGNAVPRATVRLANPSAPSVPIKEARSDDGGNFVLSGVPDGTYRLTATSPATQDYVATVTVSGSAKVEGQMKPKEIDQSGVVRGDDGKPVAGATVSSTVPGENGPRTTTTASDGTFRLRVMGGWRDLRAERSGFESTGIWGFLDGSSVTLELRKLPPPVATVRGTVTDGDGDPLAGVRVSAYGTDCCIAYASDRPYYGGEVSATTGADGRFTLGVYSTQVQLQLYKEGHASRSRHLTLDENEDRGIEVSMPRLPDKSVRVTGRVVDADTGKPVEHVGISLSFPQWGLHDCAIASQAGSTSGGSTSASGGTEPSRSSDLAIYPYQPGCGLTIDGAGRIAGTTYPGHVIVSAYHDMWAACGGEWQAGGCGKEYLPFAQTLAFTDDGTATLTVRLQPRAGPDAQASGYVLDAETGEPIVGARLSFSNHEAAGWGEAVTDKDGSYRIQLRSGFHTVAVFADGHLQHQATLDVSAGDNPLDIRLQPGEESSGGYYPYPMYAERSYTADGGGSGATPQASPAPSSTTPNGASAMDKSSEATQSEESQYQDLGGGLGPYDAATRAKAAGSPDASGGGSQDAPLAPLGLLLAAVAVALLARRRLD